jgi:DNA-binding response OmpR family regulator
MSSSFRNVVVVERDEASGLVLARALASRGWNVTRLQSGRALSSPLEREADAILLLLDDDENDVFDTLVRLASRTQRPAVVLLTRRAHARVLVPSVLSSLGVDRVIAWPCRVDEVSAALSFHPELLRLVS